MTMRCSREVEDAIYTGGIEDSRGGGESYASLF